MDGLKNTFDTIDEILAENNADQIKELNLREKSPEFEYFIARYELENQDNLKHGLEHLAELLRYDPARKEWLAILESYLEKIDDPLAMLEPEGEDRYFATEAVRAFILAKKGDTEKAIQILLAISEVKPDVPYLDCWGVEWLNQPEALNNVNQEIYLRTFINALLRFPEYNLLTAEAETRLKAYTTLFSEYHKLHEPDETSLMIHVGLLRKSGEFDHALALAEHNVQRNGGWNAIIALGLTLREKGDFAKAETTLQQAYDSDPSQGISPILEIADMYFNRADWPHALDWYNKVTAIEADNGWAHASKLYCRWKILAQSEYPEELISFSAQNTEDQRSYNLLNEFRPYIGYLPKPVEATANVLTQILEKTKDREGNPAGNKYNIKLSSLESPSNLLAFKLAFGEGFKVNLEIENIPEPDPRESVIDVSYNLWKYNGTEATQALPEPADEIAGLVADLSSKPFEKIWPLASRIAVTMSDDDIENLLSVIVHPPSVTGDFDVLDWIPRIQYSASAIIANLPGDWNNSRKREALISVLLGPRDWATEAAIVALTKLVEQQPAIALDIHNAFLKLQNAIPKTGACNYEYALYSNWLKFPNLFENEREDLRNILKGMIESE